MLKICVVSIGNEIVNGSIVDTNSNYIVSSLFARGYPDANIVALRDDMDELIFWFGRLANEYDVVITTGGLGPTFDDVTMEALAAAFNRRLKLDRDAYIDIVSKVKAKGVGLKFSHIRQAMLPEGAERIENRYGTAPGAIFKTQRGFFILLPGVPSEMRCMFDTGVMEFFERHFAVSHRFRYDLKLIGIPESDMDRFLKSLDLKDVRVVLNAGGGELTVRLFSEKRDDLDAVVASIEKSFEDNLYSKDNREISDVVDELMRKKGLSLGIVESFSGGSIIRMMSGKPTFRAGCVFNTHDEKNLSSVGGDIVICPFDLQGNRFKLLIRAPGKEGVFKGRYLGNEGFMPEAVARMSLWHLYLFLKKGLIFQR